jgi:hypothetical protein
MTAAGRPVSGQLFCCKREDFRIELFAFQEGKCHWCHGPMTMERKRTTVNGRMKDNMQFATFEHIKPRSMGGGFNRDNIRLAHGACNVKRDRRKFPHDPYRHLLASFIRERGMEGVAQ